MSNKIEEFNSYRSEMNDRLLANDNLVIKRFFNLDTNTYQDSVLSEKTKEMLGLVASLVLRCDDCVKYHLGKCYELKINRAEVLEIMQVGLVVGGSIVIPHLRRAYEYWEDLEKQDSTSK